MWSKILERMMQSFVRHGSLTITLPDGHDLKFGDGAGPRARVRIADNATLRKLVLNPELASGEAYTDGTLAVDGDDIGGFLSIVIGNMDKADRPLWQRWHQALRTALRRFMLNNVPALSRRNVAHHYDLSGDLYDLFLDSDRQYSCAYFQTPGDDLERAQEQKKHHIARKLRFEPDMHVLDIGCGWGGMALTLARDYGARVTGITLSQEQLNVALRRVREQGLREQVVRIGARRRDRTAHSPFRTDVPGEGARIDLSDAEPGGNPERHQCTDIGDQIADVVFGIFPFKV